jgi:hypothetical protein
LVDNLRLREIRGNAVMDTEYTSEEIYVMKRDIGEISSKKLMDERS